MHHDVVEQVLKAAGKRERPPPDVERAVHDELHREWLAVVASARRRRHMTMALAAGLAAAAIGAWFAAPRLAGPGEPVATVAAVFGGLRAQSGWLDGAETVREGSVLNIGDKLTTGDDGRAALTLADGVSVRLDQATHIRLAGASRIAIERGALYIDAGSTPPRARSLEVVTPAGVVTHLGTQYEIRLADSGVRLRIREGRVEWRGPAGRVESGEAGELMVIGGDGEVSREAIPTYGESWDWVAAAAPGLEIDGLPLSEFLAWAGRELGCEVEFATPALAAEAARIELRGSITGLAPREALEAVLGTTSFKATVTDGRLTVAAP